MGKLLPILGIVGAVFAALSIAVLVPDSLAAFAPLLVGLVGSIVLLAQRSVAGAVAGLVVLALTVLAGLGLVGSVSTESGGGTSLGVSVGAGHVLAIACCLALPIAAVALRWDVAEPRWLCIAGVACAVVAFILAALDPEGLTQQNQVDTLVAAVLALLSIGAMVPLLRAPDDEDATPRDGAPLAATDAHVTAHAPAKPATTKAPAAKPAPKKGP